eukprot:108007-Chlamydomonas_euryale.AAC.2
MHAHSRGHAPVAAQQRRHCVDHVGLLRDASVRQHRNQRVAHRWHHPCRKQQGLRTQQASDEVCAAGSRSLRARSCMGWGRGCKLAFVWERGACKSGRRAAHDGVRMGGRGWVRWVGGVNFAVGGVNFVVGGVNFAVVLAEGSCKSGRYEAHHEGRARMPDGWVGRGCRRRNGVRRGCECEACWHGMS